ncbi:MAG: gamma-glutamylcyclotransferase [Geminicoccaceae bacterium]
MPDGLVWYFGYGSLMWNPGFSHEAFEPAVLEGWSRALCIYSTHYRGTAGRPGLVLGLRPGGRCIGRAIGVAPEREPEVTAYLDARELLDNYVYRRVRLLLVIQGAAESVPGWCYVARPEHEDYAGGLDEAAVLRHVRQGHGLAGSCADYLRNTVAHLREMGIRETELERLEAALEQDDPLSTPEPESLSGSGDLTVGPVGSKP